MKMATLNPDINDNAYILICTSLLAVLSVFIIFLQSGEINRDGVMYLTQAQYFLEGNSSKAMSVYSWPFFSKLIVKIYLFTGLSLQYAAHALNVFFFSIAAFFYLKCLSKITSKNISPFFGLVTILTAITLMDDYLPMILRDHGQWTGYMAGVYFFLRWSETRSWVDAFFWQLSFILGSLFRPELLIFNIFLPLISLFVIENNNIKKLFLQSISIFIIGGIYLTIYFLVKHDAYHQIDLARLTELISRPQEFLINIAQPLNLDSKNYFIKILISDYSISFKYLFFSYVAIYKWVAGLGLFHVSLFFYALKKKFVQGRKLKILAMFFILSATITIINLYTTNVLSNRYWVMNWWIVYLFVAIGLSQLWYALSKKITTKRLWVRKILVLCVALHIANIFIDKREIHFEQQAGVWIKEQKIDLNNIYFNDKRTPFYAGLLTFEEVDFPKAVNIIQYEYLSIRYSSFDEVKPIDNYKIEKYFPSKDEPKLILYRRIVND